MEIVIRATVIFAFLLLFMRGLRKRTLGEMSPLQMIVLVSIGDLIQQGVTQEDYSVTGAILAVGTFGFWITVLDFASFRSHRLRRVLEGVPLVVIEDGKPVDKTLKLEQIPWEEVLESARQQGIEDVSAVKLAVLEVSGRISFIRRSPDDGS